MMIRILFTAIAVTVGSSMVMMKPCDGAHINEEQGDGLVHRTALHQAAMETKLNSFLKDIQQKHRALQGDVCTEVEEGVNQEGLDFDCDCSGDLASGENFSLTCNTRSPFCEDNICANVSFELQIGDNGSTFRVCVDYTTNVYPDICISSTVDASNGFVDCDVVIDGSSCNACDVCNNGLGVHIDCRNIRSDLFVSECQPNNGGVFVPAFESEPGIDGGDDNSPLSSSGNKANAVIVAFSAIILIVAFAIA